jgi:low molecular weight phosphotyrosine protein phosphatase
VKYVLFVCNHNAGRSQIAQAFFEQLAPPDIRAESAGSTPLDALRSDTTAHRIRLVRLLPMLAGKFAGTRSDAEIRACADAVLSQFAEVPVRSHVMTLAYRRTRECLAAETCEELAGIS